jgi:hypothetical protein
VRPGILVESLPEPAERDAGSSRAPTEGIPVRLADAEALLLAQEEGTRSRSDDGEDEQGDADAAEGDMAEGDEAAAGELPENRIPPEILTILGDLRG